MLAPAKINLDLRITGRRTDGYHLLDSIVVFTEFGDELKAEVSNQLEIDISGPFASDLPKSNNNLILKSCKLLCEVAGVQPNIKFYLTKNLPVSSGIGGGSADAAAAMNLTRKILSLNINDNNFNDIGVNVGADVPVCLRSVSSHMSGIGNKINQLYFQDDLYILLVNPRISISTSDIFKKYTKSNVDFDTQRQINNNKINLLPIIRSLNRSKNSLQNVVCNLNKEVPAILDILAKTSEVLLSRMSGSGATCFGVYHTAENCHNAANMVRLFNKDWWLKETKIL